MNYSEVELDYITDIPQLVTNIAISNSQWAHGSVGISDQDIWLPKEGGWDTIPLKAVELVDRKLPKSVVNKIISSSKNSSYIVVDYKKLSLFGTGYVTTAMIFTGDKKNIEKFKSYLMTLLGFSVDAMYGQLEPAQVRLLFLLSTGIKDVDVLLPMFDRDKLLLKHAFNVLRKRKLVDEFALVTPTGLALVEGLKGKGEGSLGKDLKTSFSNISKSWSRTTSFRATEKMNKLIWKFESSSIVGHVSTENIWRFLPVKQISSVKIEETDIGALSLIIKTKYDVIVTLESIERSIALALYVCLDPGEDSVFKLISAVYLGVKERPGFVYLCGLDSFAVESKLEHMRQTEFIDDEFNLLPKSIAMIRKYINEKMRCSSLEGTFESERLREFEMNYAKKKMMDRLGDEI
ncbi:hypothetical protein [Methanolobus profundi]|uniref:Uncharacterized protein n=1 Tax=Methanolobus profundi TaxID=487685 RepID=A0A1I4T4B5_9EURY|nr:hypothetical protein [Methanolobus profundi]SFM71526.1 hypothetical protein SAMN04488696_2183 [Methanolobus profundi]